MLFLTLKENLMKKSVRSFSHKFYWNPHTKVIPRFYERTFNVQFGYFEYVGISPIWYNIDYSQLTFQFDCYQLQLVYLILDHCPGRNLQWGDFANHYWHTGSFTACSPYTIQTFLFFLFGFQLPFYLFFSNKKENKRNVPKMLFLSSIIKRQQQHKNSPILISFLNSWW